MATPRTLIEKARRELDKPVRVKALRKSMHTNTMDNARLVSEDKPLTDMQKAFAKAIAEGNSIPASMERAGYNEQPSYGYRLVKMPNVKKLIGEYQRAYQEASKLKKEDVMAMLKKAYEVAEQLAEPASMVSAAREIGKLCGFYEPTKVDVSIRDHTQFARLSDQELFAMIEKATREAVDSVEYTALDAPS